MQYFDPQFDDWEHTKVRMNGSALVPREGRSGAQLRGGHIGMIERGDGNGVDGSEGDCKPNSEVPKLTKGGLGVIESWLWGKSDAIDGGETKTTIATTLEVKKMYLWCGVGHYGKVLDDGVCFRHRRLVDWGILETKMAKTQDYRLSHYGLARVSTMKGRKAALSRCFRASRCGEEFEGM